MEYYAFTFCTTQAQGEEKQLSSKGESCLQIGRSSYFLQRVFQYSQINAHVSTFSVTKVPCHQNIIANYITFIK